MTKIIKMYGIKNCDSVKKAQKFLKENAVDFEFIDFRVDGIDEKTVQNFIDKIGFETLINKRSTTYRNLENKDNITLNTILENPTLIKRPVLDIDNKIIVGFKIEVYTEIFNHH
jgi:arsenate reductase